MESVILVIHLMLALGIIGLVLMQRSEGGGLGMGGGGGGLGNLATAAGAANAFSKATMWFAAAFFVTSLTLAILAGGHRDNTLGAQLNKVTAEQSEAESAPEIEIDLEGIPAEDAAETEPAKEPDVPLAQ